MLRKLIFPHTFFVTVLTFLVIGILDLVRLNLHFLDPFNQGLKDYEVTDIVYSKLREDEVTLEPRIVLVNVGKPNRDTLSQMINRIAEARPAVIGVDLLLSDRKAPRADSLLQSSLKKFSNLVLGTRLEGYNEETQQFDAEVDCDTFFCDHAYPGFTNFPANDTRTIRLFSPREMTKRGESLAFSTRVTKLYDQAAADRLLSRGKPVEEIYYSGGADQFLQFEPENILDPEIDLQPLLKDKIVLIGFLGDYSWDAPLLDKHFTPLNSQYTGRNIPDMYGMVIHANIIKMVIDNVYVGELSQLVNLLLTFIFCYFNIHLFYKIHRRISVPYQFLTRFIQIAEIILLFFLVALAFHFFRFRIDFALAIAILLLTFDMIKFYENVLRQKIPFLSKIPEVLPQRVKVKKTPPPATHG